MIDKLLMEGNIRAVCMNVGGPAFTHVMYADDIILFARANGKEVKILDECIEKYCQWSGQLINRSKSGLIFSKLVQGNKKRLIKQVLNMKASPKIPHTLELLFSLHGAGAETSNFSKISLLPVCLDGEVKPCLGLGVAH